MRHLLARFTQFFQVNVFWLKPWLCKKIVIFQVWAHNTEVHCSRGRNNLNFPENRFYCRQNFRKKKKVRKLRFCDKKVRKIPFSTNDIYFLVTSKYALLLVL